MDVKEIVISSALALATAASAASMAIGYPAQQLPLLLLQFPNMVPATGSCDEVCNLPVNDHSSQPATVNPVAFGPTP